MARFAVACRATTKDQTPPAALAARWRLRDGSLTLQMPQIMAICSVTPDPRVAVSCELLSTAGAR